MSQNNAKFFSGSFYRTNNFFTSHQEFEFPSTTFLKLRLLPQIFLRSNDHILTFFLQIYHTISKRVGRNPFSSILISFLKKKSSVFEKKLPLRKIIGTKYVFLSNLCKIGIDNCIAVIVVHHLIPLRQHDISPGRTGATSLDKVLYFT